MPEPKPKQDALYVRVTPEVKAQFAEATKRLGEPWTPSDVLRELVRAFIENRVTVLPPSNVKEFFNVPRSEDQ